MKYYSINKVELENGEVKRTPLGYVEARSAVDVLTGYCGCWTGWVEDNVAELDAGTKTLSDLFANHPICHEEGSETDYIPEGLSLITSV